MKRGREDGGVETVDMKNCMMLLSKVGQIDVRKGSEAGSFVCKTCDRRFPSFQALGGHRASHKKQRLTAGDLLYPTPGSPVKPKSHECSICGLKFAIGQALGGHMRRHRDVMGGSLLISDRPVQALPVINKSNSKEVPRLDLNLIPVGTDLKLCSW